MTIRALLVGFLGAMFIAGAGYINDRILLLESFNNGHQIPIIVIGFLILWVVAINPALGKISKQLAFHPAEIALVIILLMGACSIPGRGLLEQFTQTLVMPFHWVETKPGWREQNLLGYAPKEALVDATDHDNVVTRFVTGSDRPSLPAPTLYGRLRHKVLQVPWSAWRRPLATWLPMVFLSAFCMVAMALIVHRQWSSHEHLQYPIANFTSALIDRKEGQSYAPVLLNRLFWIGFLVCLFIRVNNGMCRWYPEFLIPIRLDFSFASFVAKWPALRRNHWCWGLMTLRVFPLVIAFAFFLSSEISFTMGISQVLWACFAIPAVGYGINLSTDYDIGGWTGWHRAGSYTAFTLMLLYAGRRRYTELLRRAFFVKREGDTAEDGGAWAMRVLLVCTCLLIGMTIRLGLSWPIAVLTIGWMLVTFLIVSRISAETGLFFIQPGWQPFGALMALFGGYAMGPTAIVVSALVCAVLCIDQSQALMPYLINGFKIAEKLKLKAGRVAVATTSMYVVGILLAVFVVLVVSYDFGTPVGYHYSYYRVPTMAYRAAEPKLMRLKAVDKLEESEALSGLQRLRAMRPEPLFLWAAGSGFLLVLVFSLLRLRLSWWPLHPVLFLIWATYPLSAMSNSFLLGWAVKKSSQKFGGNQVVQKLKPLAIGVIAGEISGALVFMVIGAVYYFVTGEKPITYRFFPR